MPPVDFELKSYTEPSGDTVNFNLGVVPKRFPLGFMVYKKLGRPDKVDPLNVHGIYQRRMLKNGKGYIKMKFYEPTNPRTTAQQANRQKFTDGMAAWQALTEEEKTTYIKRAKKRNMFGWGLFLREYFINN